MISVDDWIATLPIERQKAIEARGKELIAALRKERKISQATVAKALGIGQMQISRLEKRKDPRLSTMARTVAAMGGQLTMIATFPDQEPVVLVASEFAEKNSRQTGGKKARA
jgi:transcriptional regulator with XRE-family HTH domain